MKYIKIPEDLVLGTDNEGKEVKHSFIQWLANPLNGAPFGVDGKTLRMSVKLELRFEPKVPGDVVALADDEWAILHASAEKADKGFNTPMAKLFLGYMDVIKEAPEEDPRDAEDTDDSVEVDLDD